MAALYTERAIIQQGRAGRLPEARAQLAALEATNAPEHIRAQAAESLRAIETEARTSQRMPAARGWVAPDAQVSHTYALIARRAGEAWTTRMRFHHALKLDPGFYDARYNFALWLAARGEADAAWGHYLVLSQAPEVMGPQLEITLLRVIESAAQAAGAESIASRCAGRTEALENK